MDNFQRKKMTVMLVSFLPFGVMSRHGLDCVIRGDTESRYALAKLGMIEKHTIELKDPDRKRKLVLYAITNKGIDFLKVSQFPLPGWFPYLNTSEPYGLWGRQSVAGVQRLAQVQEAIMLFFLAMQNTLRDECWRSSPWATFTLNGFVQTWGSSHGVPGEILQAMLKYRADVTGEDWAEWLQDPTEGQRRHIEAILQNMAPWTGFRAVQEISYCYRQTGVDDTHQGTRQDNCIGFFAGAQQEFPVYITSSYGLKYSCKGTTMGQSYNRILAVRAFRNSTLSAQRRCQSCLVLCRNEKELARAVLDPYMIRKSKDKELLRNYFRVYLVPLRWEGAKHLRQLEQVDPTRQADFERELLVKLAEAAEDLSLTDGSNPRVILTTTGEEVTNGCLLELRSLYQLMKRSEEERTKVWLACETWQVPYYQALDELWQKTPLQSKRKHRGHGFKLLPVKGVLAL